MTITKLHPLKLNELRTMEEGSVIASGICLNCHKKGIKISNDYPERHFVWTAIKGEKRLWYITYHWRNRFPQFKKEIKLINEQHILYLVPAEFDALCCYQK